MHLQQLVTTYLQNQLKHHAADTPEIWANTGSLHIVLRVAHQAGKLRLLSLLTLLSACTHQASAVILLANAEAQQLLLQALHNISGEVSQLAAATKNGPAATHLWAEEVNASSPQKPICALHAEAMTLSCGSHIVTVDWALQSPSRGQDSAQPNSVPKYVFMVADHSLSVDDAYLRRFWGQLLQQQQQQQQPAATLLSVAFGDLGLLWRMVSATYSLPGLSSALTPSTEAGFTQHHIQTALPADCIAHPMTLPGKPKQEVQCQVVPTTAAALVQSANSSHNSSSPSWWSVRPGLLQWLSALTEAAAATAATTTAAAAAAAAAAATTAGISAAPSATVTPVSASTRTAAGDEGWSEAKLMVVVGMPGVNVNGLLSYVRQSSSLSVAVLELDQDPGCKPGVLAMTPDIAELILGSMPAGMLAGGGSQGGTDRVMGGQLAAKLLFQGSLSIAQKLRATCAALSGAQAKHEQPIHGVIFLSWACLEEGLPLELTQAVSDLYLCDLADCIAADIESPMTEMTARALDVMTILLCGVHDE